MKVLKKIVIDSLLSRISASPFLLVVDYSGMKVSEFEELRKRLAETGAKLQVAKNTFVKQVAASVEYPDGLSAFLTGQTAVVTGTADVCASAKVVKTYGKQINKLAIRGGVLDGNLLQDAQVLAPQVAQVHQVVAQGVVLRQVGVLGQGTLQQGAG